MLTWWTMGRVRVCDGNGALHGRRNALKNALGNALEAGPGRLALQTGVAGRRRPLHLKQKK